MAAILDFQNGCHWKHIFSLASLLRQVNLWSKCLIIHFKWSGNQWTHFPDARDIIWYGKFHFLCNALILAAYYSLGFSKWPLLNIHFSQYLGLYGIQGSEFGGYTYISKCWAQNQMFTFVRSCYVGHLGFSKWPLLKNTFPNISASTACRAVISVAVPILLMTTNPLKLTSIRYVYAKQRYVPYKHTRRPHVWYI